MYGARKYPNSPHGKSKLKFVCGREFKDQMFWKSMNLISSCPRFKLFFKVRYKYVVNLIFLLHTVKHGSFTTKQLALGPKLGGKKLGLYFTVQTLISINKRDLLRHAQGALSYLST